MTAVLDYLKRLNRKERFLVLEEALGVGTFSLDHRFRDRLQHCLGRRLPKTCIPQDAFVAMDYHMDWIQLALHLAEELPGFLDGRDMEEDICHSKDKSGGDLFRGNQQDIDLLVAFDDSEKTHIIMIEAKAETYWTNKQLNEENGKIKRLKAIFGEDRCESDPIIPHLVLLSPKYSKELESSKWPSWAKYETQDRHDYYWLKLPHPELVQVRRTERAESSDGRKRLNIKRKPANLIS